MAASPVKPVDFKNAVPDPTSSLCGGFVDALLKLPTTLYQLVNWLLDSSGNVTNEFKQQIIPPGFRMDSFVDISPSAYWLKCDGSEVSQATYPALYAAIGATFGAASPGNFKLPDCRARFPVTVGTFASAGSVAIGGTGGADTHHIVPAELPKIQLGLLAAVGTDLRWNAADATGATKNGQGVGSLGSVGDRPGVVTEAIGNSDPTKGVDFNMVPPYFGVYTFIKT